jgi:hypothetical protein
VTEKCCPLHPRFHMDGTEKPGCYGGLGGPAWTERLPIIFGSVNPSSGTGSVRPSLEDPFCRIGCRNAANSGQLLFSLYKNKSLWASWTGQSKGFGCGIFGVVGVPMLSSFAVSVTALSGMCTGSRDRHANEKPGLPIAKIAQRFLNLGGGVVRETSAFGRGLAEIHFRRCEAVEGGARLSRGLPNPESAGFPRDPSRSTSRRWACRLGRLAMAGSHSCAPQMSGSQLYLRSRDAARHMFR